MIITRLNRDNRNNHQRGQYYLFMQHDYKAGLIISGVKQAGFQHLLKFEEIDRLNLDCYLNAPNICSKADVVNGFRPYVIEYGGTWV